MMESALHNEHSIAEQNGASFLRRLCLYQKERFPFLSHGPLIMVFSFSAVSYSRICRGAEGFIEPGIFLPGAFLTVTLFFLLRIFDEFKDAEDDAALRKHLPVPRGLISLRELGTTGVVVFLLQLLVIFVFFPPMILLYGVVALYLCLMGKEFFVASWLKRHQFWYVVSHMLIIPLVDVFASGLDWYLADAHAPEGLLYFFAVSFMNGIVLEIGRKIRVPGNEEHNTYSTMLGGTRATVLWIVMLLVTFSLAVLACSFAGYGVTGLLVLTVILAICILPGLIFLSSRTQKTSKLIEYASGLWTAAMYLTLGGAPMIKQLAGW